MSLLLLDWLVIAVYGLTIAVSLLTRPAPADHPRTTTVSDWRWLLVPAQSGARNYLGWLLLLLGVCFLLWFLMR